MLDRDSLGSTLGAFLTGVAITSGPWLLTTFVLVALRVSALGTGVVGVPQAELVITVVYATVIVVSAPIDIVLSRYASDRVYEGKRESIAAPLRTLLATCLVLFTAVGATAMTVIRVPLEIAIPGTLLAEVVGLQWLLLSAAGGLSSPAIILRSFALGAPVSVIGVVLLGRPDVLGPLGYLYGYGAGQVVTLSLLLWGTFRALPAEEEEDATLVSAFRTYWLLAAAAAAFHAGLWIDKLVVFFLAGSTLASSYAATAAVAWLSVVPACAYLFVAVETVFHRRFRDYYAALHTGATLAELEQLAANVRTEVARTLRGTAAVQACVTLVCLFAVPRITGNLALSPDGTAGPLPWLLIGAGIQVIAMATTLLLYYFDFRREAFIAALVQLAGNGVFALVVGAPSPVLGVGYTAACALTCVVGLVLLRRCLADLLIRTFQSQPYVTEDHAAPVAVST